MIEVRGLGKRFGRVQAIDGISFGAADGRITALLGPNGAGKSTTLRILATVLKPDAGSARIDGHEIGTEDDAVRRQIGVLPHRPGLYDRLTARENIAYFGALHGMRGERLEHRIDDLVRHFDMSDFAHRRVSGFSQGQRIKVALARALVHDPRNVLLDEPTNGLDVMATRALRESVLALKAEGRCVVFSSHVMQEVASLCEDVIIIGAGRVRFAGTLTELLEVSGQADLEEAFIRLIGPSPA
jgi:sodium transport system ATP-binding protein